MNPGNLNSETGLPLAVFGVRSDHKVGVFELGMNRRGEIGELAEVLKPHIALITHIGSAHIGILGSRDAIAEEKKNIFSRFRGDELALIPDDDDYRSYLAQDVKGRVGFYGFNSLDELGDVKDLGLAGAELEWAGEKIRFALPGRHNLKNALAAAALACEAGISGKAVREGLESVRSLFGRSEILRGKTTVIRDCYNANPDSVTQALEFCDGAEWPGRRVYVMGAMLELGTYSGAAHSELGRRLAASRGDMVFLYGKEMAPARDVLMGEGKPPFFYTAVMDDLERAVSAYIQPGDLVLLKGSRACGLEQLTGTVLIKEGAVYAS
jgi:UDP-N-acetylmuramoyl-tripeptide--D-alanyl-D-alanine ligase